MAALELDGRLLIIDVGLSFPSADMPGIDLVLPDMEFVRDRADDVVGGRADPRARGPRRVRSRTCSATSDAASRSTARRSRSSCSAASSRSTRSRTSSRRALAVPGGSATVGPVLDALLPRHALDPGRDGDRDRHAARHPAAHGRLQARPDPDRRAAHRSARPRRGGRPRRAPAAVGFDERGGAGPHGQRTQRRAGAARHRGAGARDRGGGVLLQPHPPDPAGGRRGPRRRSGSSLPRPLDAATPSRRRAGSGSSTWTTAT